MNKIKGWILKHQVSSFFLLAFLITWPGFFLAFYVFPGNQIVEVLISWIVFGPAIAAMIVAGTADPEPKSEPSKKRWISFLVK